MASSSTSLSAASSSSTQQWKYDVFLSFRGEDTRKSFTDHLHAALCRCGIITFRDDQLRRGEKISTALLRKIEESRFSIIILSENYASSSWCLDELTKILECVKERGHTALPVFYNVDPSHVRKQKGSFAEAFVRHEQVYREKMEEVVKWRKALSEAGTISGWDTRNRNESEVIEKIVTRILTEQSDASSSNMDALVGRDSCIEDMISLLCIGSNEVQFVGIWGMAGIGKTSIAEAVYERIRAKFEGCCFLENIREDSQRRGLSYLKRKMVSQILGEETKYFNTGINFIKARLHSRKVLIILDEVYNQQQLQALAGGHDWFGQGSRIIITTRDKYLLNTVDATYKVEELARDEAHKLFRWHAFVQNPITEDYMQLCNDAVDYIKGHPLALTVLGSFLCNSNIAEWKRALDKLKMIPHEDVHKMLKLSFDELDHTQKEIFLNIACFFRGEDKYFVTEILKSCDLFPDINISVLIRKSLITVSNNKLCMHDLLQEMGWKIVWQEDVNYPGKRSRLWVHDEVNDVLTTNMGTEAVEGIAFDLSESKLNLNVDAFAKMRNLRLLRFYNFQFGGSSEYLSGKELIDGIHDDWRWWDYEMYNSLHNDSKLHLSGDFKFPSNKLSSLYWHGYPLKSLPSNFHPDKLVELNLCYSKLEQLWEGNKLLEKLKFIKLSHSQHLTRTPDFFGAPNLRELILEGCTSLVEVHPSIGFLKQLIVLNLKGCKNLESFSSSIHMESLRILITSGCSKLKKFPEVQGIMKDLPELSLEGTAIEGLPLSIECLTGLVLLNLKDCKRLETLPSSIFKLKSLKNLILSNCSRLKKLPEILENMEGLMELFLDGTCIRQLPLSIGHLNGLVLLNLRNCKKLASLEESICKLTSLQTLILSGCSELKKLPDGLDSLQRLVELNAEGSGIQEVPPSITSLSSLQRLSFARCKGIKGLGSSFYSLRSLNLSDCNLLQLSGDLSSLSSLNYLDLSRNSFITVHDSLSQLSQLETLMLMNCKSLQSLSTLPSRIKYLDAHGCTSLETVSFSLLAYKVEEFGNFQYKFTNCFRLAENQRSDIVEAILEGIQLASSIPKFLKPHWDSGCMPTSQNGYNAFVPGSRIPMWFTHQNVGSSIRVELPSHWYNSKLMGLAVCVVFKINEDWASHRIHCFLYDLYCFSSSINLAKRTRFIMSDHTWFGYQSLAELEYQCLDRDLCGPVEFSFRGPPDVGSFEVKKCGVRIVYEQDENDRGCIFPFGKLLEDRDIAFLEHGLGSSGYRDHALHYLCSRDANEEWQGGSSDGSELELNLPYSSFKFTDSVENFQSNCLSWSTEVESYEPKCEVGYQSIKQKMEELNRMKDLVCLFLSYPVNMVNKGIHESWVLHVLKINREVRKIEAPSKKEKIISPYVWELYSEIITLLRHSMDDIEAYVPREMIEKMRQKTLGVGKITPIDAELQTPSDSEEEQGKKATIHRESLTLSDSEVEQGKKTTIHRKSQTLSDSEVEQGRKTNIQRERQILSDSEVEQGRKTTIHRGRQLILSDSEVEQSRKTAICRKSEALSYPEIEQSEKASSQHYEKIPVPDNMLNVAVQFVIRQILIDIENPEVRRIGISGRDGIRVISELKNLQQIRKMFDVVVQVPASADSTIIDIVENIAVQLGVSLFGRKKLGKLLKKKNFLILLDYIHENINLSQLGTDWWNSKKIQKMVSTTRLQQVHHRMEIDLEIRMEDHLLPWELFCMNVGEVVHSSRIQDVAVDVVDGCCGHLLAIVLMGRALKEVNDVSIWKHASHALCLCPTSQMKDSILFNALAFICEQLGSKTNCVKHCALNMDKEGMDKVHLIQRWIKDGLIGTLDEGEVVVQDLLKAFLLESSQNGVSVRMRDEIREELGNLFRPKLNPPVLNLGGKGLTMPPNDEAWEEAGEIHLMNNELSELPDSPNCPQLRVLLLQANPFLTVIPSSFFEHMISLQILDLSHTRIRFLPDSLFKLFKLRNFFLRGCELFMEVPPKVGELGNLEVLDFEGTEIISLPMDVGKLSKLTCLKLSFYGEDKDERKNDSLTPIIPQNVIGKLLQLEELSIDVNPDDENWNVTVKNIIKEVCSLKRLKVLKLYLPEVVLLNDFMWNIEISFLSLSRFSFIVGGHLKRIISRLPCETTFKFKQQERCLKYVNGEDVPIEIKEVLQYATALFLDRHLTLTKLSEFGIENMKRLEVCILGECKEIQTLVDGAEINKQEDNAGDVNEGAVLGSLQYLSIHYMKNLRSIWKGPVQKGCLSRLKSLALHTCPQLSTIFTLDLLENLNILEELVIENCPKVNSIVTHELPAEEIQLCSIEHLPKLKKISLHYMRKLVSISSGLRIAPKVEWMSFYGCPNLKTLSPMDVSISSNLKGIIGEVDWWNELTWNVQPENLDSIFVAIEGATELMNQLAKIGDQLQH